jgi:hypothetical protein
MTIAKHIAFPIAAIIVFGLVSIFPWIPANADEATSSESGEPTAVAPSRDWLGGRLYTAERETS